MWLFGHWVSDSITQTYATTMWSGDNVPSAGNTFGNPSYSGVVHSTYSISPTLLNELAFNYNGNRINILPDSTALGVLDRTKDGVNIPLLFPNTTNLDNRIPGISLIGNSEPTTPSTGFPGPTRPTIIRFATISRSLRVPTS